MEFLNNKQKNEIGYNFILNNLEIHTPMGLKQKKNLTPYKKAEKSALIRELNNTERIIKSYKKNLLLYEKIENILLKFKDITISINKCINKLCLDEVELYEIKYFALLSEELMNVLLPLNLSINDVKLHSLKNIISLLDPENNHIPTFSIYDSYSKNLRDIRDKKKQIEEIIFYNVSNKNIKKLKEERLQLVVLESEEELKIKKLLSHKISIYGDSILKNLTSIGKLDLLIAKAKISIKYNGVKPEIIENGKIELDGCFNPEIIELLKKSDNIFTPISIELKSGTTIITGANMAGKSVSLKTIILNLMLVQIGFFIFAKSGTVPQLDFIYLISDDLQCVSKGLSSFGAEIIMMKHIVNEAEYKTGFIGLDEFAKGTNPNEGTSLVKAISTYFNSLPSFTLITTHYDGVTKDYDKSITHYQVIGLKNVDFTKLKTKHNFSSAKYNNKISEIEILQKLMDYRLEIVSNNFLVPKDALNVASFLGLQEDIIKMAEENYKGGNFLGK